MNTRTITQEGRRETILELKRVNKRFGDFQANRDISFKINDGEFFTIVGPSGSGKTTLLRMLVGMDKPTSGDIILKGQTINDIPANRRPTCMVFQSLALFPHMTVGENIEFPMRMKGGYEGDRMTMVSELMRLLHLPWDYYRKKVTQCSGGERQRIALARALAYDPEILFFDEPLSAIDARLRKILQKELKDIQRKTGKTFVYVTHSLEEAMLMSDRVAIMRDGCIEQIGTPDEIYRNPKNSFVAEFMGEVNQFPVVTESGNLLRCTEHKMQFTSPVAVGEGRNCVLIVRPESIRFLSDGASAENRFPVRVINEYSLGSRSQYHVEACGKILTVERLNEDHERAVTLAEIGWDAGDSILLEA